MLHRYFSLQEMATYFLLKIYCYKFNIIQNLKTRIKTTVFHDYMIIDYMIIDCSDNVRPRLQRYQALQIIQIKLKLEFQMY